MSKERKQRVLLASLGVFLVIMAWRQLGGLWTSSGAGTSVAGSVTARQEPGEADRYSGALPEIEELRLDDLQAVSGELSAGRNPFRIDEPPPPTQPQQSNTEMLEALERARRRKTPEQAVRKEPAKPTPPPVDVVFLGSFGPQDKKLAVFSDGREIYNVTAGEILKDKFVLMRVGFESADLGFVGFPDAPTQRLEIGG